MWPLDQAHTYDFRVSKMFGRKKTHIREEKKKVKNLCNHDRIALNLIFRSIAFLINKIMTYNDEVLYIAVKRYPAMFDKTKFGKSK